MSRSIDGVVNGKRFAGALPTGRVLPKVEPERQSSETRPLSRGSKVGTRRVNALPAGSVPANRPKSWKERLQLPIIVIGGMLAGLAIQNAMLGQVLIVGYGIAALVYKIPSRTTFIVALGAMLIMLGSLIFRGDVLTSQTFAVYSFLLLVVGVITLNREVKREGGRVYSRRYR